MNKLAPILIIFFFSTATYAQLPEAFLGKWVGSGTLYNSEATFTMEWERVLNEQFYRLNFTNALSNGAFSMSAHGYYKSEGDSVSGHWLDSRGVSFPLTGVMEEHTLIIHWGTEDFEQGRTEYTLLASGEVEVIDFVLRNGEYAQFGNAIYQRKQE